MKGRKTAYLYLLSVATLILLVWSTFASIRQPNIGVFWEYSTGIVYQIDPSHPSAYQVQKGDIVLAGDGHPANEIYRLISSKAGQSITLTIDRNGTTISARMQLLEPVTSLLISRLSPLLIALALWASSSIIYAFSKVTKQNIVFFLFCQVLAITLASGAVSSFSMYWIKALFQAGMIWSGVFAVHLHTMFPNGVTFQNKKPLLFIVSSTACLLTAALVLMQATQHPRMFDRLLGLLCLSFLLLSFLVVVFLWFKSFFHATSAVERKQAGIMALFGILGFSPLIVFSVIPDILMGSTLVPYDISLSGLTVLPIGYSYAIHRYKIGIDRTLHRGSTFVLVLMVMAGLFTLSYSLEQRFVGNQIAFHPAWELITTLTLAVTFRLIYDRLTIFTERLLYGSWYDYRSIVHNVSTSLKMTETDPKSIAATICQTVGRSMQLEYAALFLYDGEYVSYEVGRDMQVSKQPLEILDCLYQETQETIIEMNEANRKLIFGSLAELNINASSLREKMQFVVPIGDSQNKMGVFILGNKLGRGVLTSVDWEILEAVMQQAKIGIENARLIQDLQEHASVIRNLNRKVGLTREEEQKRVARDLHDIVVQALIGLKFNVANLRSANANDLEWENTQQKIQQIVAYTRQICSNLRLTSLEKEGLIATLHYRIQQLNQELPFHIQLHVSGNDNQVISEEISLTLFRFFNECISNIQKHAQADRVVIQIDIKPGELKMVIQDNGRGFQAPTRLDTLAADEHFGLIGQRELLAMVDGSLQIFSAPGEGSCISARIPLLVKAP